VPRLYVETKPAELIVTDGAAKFAAIEGTALLYADRQARTTGETRAGNYHRGSYRTATPRSGGRRR
jgi:hypothetical protein